MLKLNIGLKLLLASFFMWIFYSLLSGSSSVVNQVKLHRGNAHLLDKIDSLAAVKAALDGERARLRSDTAYLEKVVRMELGMARPDEKVFRLYSEKKDLSGSHDERD